MQAQAMVTVKTSRKRDQEQWEKPRLELQEFLVQDIYETLSCLTSLCTLRVHCDG